MLNQRGDQKRAEEILMEALDFSRGIENEYDKSRLISKVAIQLAKNGQISKALFHAREIAVKDIKISTLSVISTDMFQLGNSKEAESIIMECLACTREINSEQFYSDSTKSRALRYIAVELAKQGKVEEAEKLTIEITLQSTRINCWQEIAASMNEKLIWHESLAKGMHMENVEARLFYLKGWVEVLQPTDTDLACLMEVLPIFLKDTQSIGKLLEKFALHELFFGDSKQELIQRFNRTLNIQWAIDIKNQLPN